MPWYTQLYNITCRRPQILVSSPNPLFTVEESWFCVSENLGPSPLRGPGSVSLKSHFARLRSEDDPVLRQSGIRKKKPPRFDLQKTLGNSTMPKLCLGFLQKVWHPADPTSEDDWVDPDDFFYRYYLSELTIDGNGKFLRLGDAGSDPYIYTISNLNQLLQSFCPPQKNSSETAEEAV